MKILVVEDVRLMGLMLKNILAQLGYRDVCLVGSAEEAVNHLTIQPFDLFFVDWMLPGANGVEFVRWLRCMVPYQDVPIVMVTGNDTYEEVVEALEAGADDYLLKPVEQERLAAKLKHLLGEEPPEYRHGEALSQAAAIEPEQSRPTPSEPE